MTFKHPDSLISVLIIALLASLCFGVKCCVDKDTLQYEKDSVIRINLGGDWMQSPSRASSLSKDELKALDLKLRQEAITFREGERVVYLPTMQTAIVLDFATQLRGRGYQTALIQFQNSIEKKAVSAFDLIKIGEDYVEPIKSSCSYDTLIGKLPKGVKVDTDIDSIIITYGEPYTVQTPNSIRVKYSFKDGRYRNQVELP